MKTALFRSAFDFTALNFFLVLFIRSTIVLFLELEVGFNTPVIIKYPFWQMTAKNPNAVYACVNFNEAFCPDELKEKSICINGDIAEVFRDIG